jgi:hypothetical protein
MYSSRDQQTLWVFDRFLRHAEAGEELGTFSEHETTEARPRIEACHMKMIPVLVSCSNE